MKQYTFRFYPSTIEEIDQLVKKDRNFTSRADWVRTKIEALIVSGEINKISDDIDTDKIIKEVIAVLANNITEHENRMYKRVSKLEQILGKIIYKIEVTDPQTAEISNYLESISEQLYKEKLEKTSQIHLPSKLLPLLKYEWYGDYISDWVNQQEELGNLSLRRGRIYWNEKSIREMYFIE